MDELARANRQAAVDLHFHLLPGVDDGPATMADTLELARAAADQDTGTAVATPHVRPDFVTDPLELPGRVAEVRAVLAYHGPRDLLANGVDRPLAMTNK